MGLSKANKICFHRRRNRSKRNNRFHAERYRLVVNRSLKNIMAQIIDDQNGVTLASAASNDKKIQAKIQKTKSKIEQSQIVGEQLAKNAKNAKIEKVVFDRNGYPYQGRVKALADGARAGGLDF